MTTRLALLCGAVLIDMIGFGIVLPLLPFYALSFEASPFDVTLLIASFSAMQLAAAPLWGRLSDAHGRKPILLIGLLVSAVAYVLFALASTLPMLYVARLLAGAAGGTVSVAQAYVADTTTSKERARGLGYIGAAAGLGVMIGPAIGGVFSRWGLGAPGWVAAALCLIDAIAILFLLPESRLSRAAAARAEVAGRTGRRRTLTIGAWARALTTPPLSLLLGVYFLSISSFAAMTSTLALYVERAFAMDAQQMGWVLTASGGVTVVVRGILLGPLVARFGEATTARVGAASLALALLLVPLIPGKWWLAAVVLFYAGGAGTLFPSLASLVSRATHADVQGAILGGSQMIGGLGRVIGPLWAGLAFERIGIGSPFLIGASIVACAAVLALRIPAADDEDSAPAEAAGTARTDEAIVEEAPVRSSP
ncbi:MAG TPA: MFS transporter [Longimicrobiales bacterium]|nr:MFS transporter [Longimicrobiales bacterium]